MCGSGTLAAKPERDDGQVHARLQEVHGGRVSDPMRRDMMVA